MKRLLITALLLFAFVGLSQGQINRNDNLFNDWSDVGNGLDKGSGIELPPVPGGHGMGGDVPVPLGSGLFILTALGAGYAIKKCRDVS